MRSNTPVTITVNIPEHHLLTSIHPITCGPYGGHDVLLVVDDMMGSCRVIRARLTGEHLTTSEKVRRADAPALVEQMIRKQMDADCNAVTGGGRWGCE